MFPCYLFLRFYISFLFRPTCRYSTASCGIYAELQTTVEATRTSFPSDQVVIAGDFNAHLFGDASSLFDRSFTTLDTTFRFEGWLRFPATATTTYRQGSRASTIDYIFSMGLESPGFQVEKKFIALHRPLSFIFFISSRCPTLRHPPK